MKKLWLACAAICAVSASGAAYADDSLSGLRRFDGFYVGVDAGAGFLTTSPVAAPSGSYFDPANLPGVEAAGTSEHFALRKPIGGIEAGYNVQFDHWLVGLEADFNSFHMNGSKDAIAPYETSGVPFSFLQGINTDWMLTARPRVGWVSGPALFYLTAGFAMTQADMQATFADGYFAYANGSKSELMMGWTVGGGIEYRIGRAWSLKAEYLHADFGNLTSTSKLAPSFGAQSFRNSIEVATDMARIGLNYHFGMPALAAETEAMVPLPPLILTPASAPMALASPAEHEFIVFFVFDQSTLTTDARNVVEAAAQYARDNGVATIQVAGYTDLAGGTAYNLRLSQARADTVSRYLERLGISRSEIVETWHGKENPRVPTPDGVREPQNRRVEISL